MGEVLWNVSIKEGDLTDALKFLNSIEDEPKKTKARELFAAVWSAKVADARTMGMCEDKVAREKLKADVFARINAIRELAKVADLGAVRVSDVRRMQRSLGISILDVLKIVGISPAILRGLWKPPRPYFAWIVPAVTALGVGLVLMNAFPSVSAWVVYVVVMGIVILGTLFLCMKASIAPGVLRYARTIAYVRRRDRGHAREDRNGNGDGERRHQRARVRAQRSL